jgi:copper(I)-binding protein
MRRLVPLLSVLALAPVLGAAAPRAVEVDIRQAWARPVAGAGMNSAGYMVLANRGRAPLTLTGASSPLAREVMVHRTMEKDGVSSMRAMTQGLVIPPGGQVAFAPGGNHFMVMGLKRPLKPGERLALTLTFDGGRKVEAQLAVRTAPPQPAAAAAPVAPHRH